MEMEKEIEKEKEIEEVMENEANENYKELQQSTLDLKLFNFEGKLVDFTSILNSTKKLILVFTRHFH